MPPLPWTLGRYGPEDGAGVHALASTLSLRRYRDVPRFVRWALRIRGQLATAEGCAGYSLEAQLARKTFSTLSAWSSAAAMNDFVHGAEHARMLRDMSGRVGSSTFVEFGARPSELPLDWTSAKRRLADRAARSS